MSKLQKNETYLFYKKILSDRSKFQDDRTPLATKNIKLAAEKVNNT